MKNYGFYKTKKGNLINVNEISYIDVHQKIVVLQGKDWRATTDVIEDLIEIIKTEDLIIYKHESEDK